MLRVCVRGFIATNVHLGRLWDARVLHVDPVIMGPPGNADGPGLYLPHS